MNDEALAWLSVLSGARCKWFCIWFSWCHCHPIISCFIKIQISILFLAPTYESCPGKKAVKWCLRSVAWPLENAYWRPKNGVLGNLTRKCGAASTRPPKGTSFCRKMSYDIQTVKISPSIFAQLTLLLNPKILRFIMLFSLPDIQSASFLGGSCTPNNT